MVPGLKFSEKENFFQKKSQKTEKKSKKFEKNPKNIPENLKKVKFLQLLKKIKRPRIRSTYTYNVYVSFLLLRKQKKERELTVLSLLLY